ncbi:hypothetical protein [Nostoc sp. ChiQUE01b]|uniref:hypothetical protein n=1 Tax=Nostoc sp. ChiQUE01b TaxID=3075376 RepID=UPI002AD36ECC|nr:hypothetical protein [Nostoc sp. ChiQUE01b]
MATEPIITNERVDDIPVLLTQIQKMGIGKLIDKHFPTHGNWQGESLGSVAVIWLTHILSQADHRLNHVQGWASKRLETLKTLMGDSLQELDLTVDRLEAVLRQGYFILKSCLTVSSPKEQSRWACAMFENIWSRYKLSVKLRAMVKI